MEPVLPAGEYAWLQVNPFGTPPRFWGDVVAAAHGAALVLHKPYGAFIVDREHGISGPYELGKYAGAAFGGGGALYIARADATLLRARRLANGRWAPLDEVGRVPNAKQWRAGGTILASFDGSSVSTSRDHGVTWSRASLGADVVVNELFIRSDDVLVVDASGENDRQTYVSTDRGRSFLRTVPVGRLTQLGDWIYGSENCAPKMVWTVLASDGRTWVVAPGPPSPLPYQRERGTMEMFIATPQLVASSREPEPWADDLTPPSATQKRFEPRKTCVRLGTVRRTKAVRWIQEHDLYRPCFALGCLRYWRVPPPRWTRTSAYLLHDGLCATPSGEGACSVGSLLRPPHALFVADTHGTPSTVRTVSVVPIPASCHPRFVTYAAGLMILACAEPSGRTTIYTASADARWQFEASLPIGDELTSDDFEMRLDGTAMLASYGELARAYVRVPGEVGARDLWRDVSRAHASGFVLHEHGAVDVVIAEPDRGPDVFTLIEDSPNRAPRTLLEHVRVHGDLWCLGRRDGVVTGVRRSGRETFEEVIFEGGGVRQITPLSEGAFWSGMHSHYGMCGERG